MDYMRGLSAALKTLLPWWVITTMLTGQAFAAVNTQALQTKNLDRNLEPVVVRGLQVNALINTDLQQLYVYTFSADSLVGPIPFQIDEVTASGSYTTAEDNLLDANDEIVFMAKDLGDWPSDTSALNAFTAWYEIEVIDPLTGHRGWAYLVRRSPTSVSGNYVDYDSGTWLISSSQYNVGFANTHFGLDYLTLNGSSTDILDRTKLRVTRPLFPTVNEENLGGPAPVEIKDGRVRVILQRSVDFTLASLTSTYLAYSSTVQMLTQVDSSVSVSKVRMSVDLNSNANGATFYNANTPPGGVSIDGSPDETVAATPFSNWAQVSYSTGRVVQVADPTLAGGTRKNYYCDDSARVSTECDGTPTTGANGAYGDVGLLVEGSLNQSFTMTSTLYVLDNSAGNVGATYKNYFLNPLVVITFAQGQREEIFLPIVLKNSR